jgi:hypothetical protein
MKDPENMHPQNKTDKVRHLSAARYALTKAEKEIFFKVLSSIKVPSSFSSNIKGIINMTEKNSKT